MSRSKLWKIAVGFALVSFLVFAYAVPYLWSGLAISAGVPEARDATYESIKQPFFLVGLVSAVVILLQPLIRRPHDK